MIALKPESYNRNYLRISFFEKYLRYTLYLLLLILFLYPIYIKILSWNSNKSFLITNDNLGMINATLNYSDIKGNNFLIKASKAIHKSEDELIFSKINAYHSNINKNEINLLSDLAEYNNITKALHFPGKFFVSSDNDFNLTSQFANYDVSNSVISGNRNIFFENYVGKFNADSFELDISNKYYKFENNIIINLKSNRDNAQIKANNIFVDENKFLIIARDQPIYKDDELFLSGDELLINYKNGESDKIIIDKITINNNIKIIHNDSVITGDRAIYYNEISEIEIINNVILKQKDNSIKGSRLKYYLKDSSIRMLDSGSSKVELKYRNE